MVIPQVTVEDNGNTFEIYARDSFYAYLIFQEGDYWHKFPDQFDIDSFNFIINRRGFNQGEIENLKSLCLFAGLKDIWKSE